MNTVANIAEMVMGHRETATPAQPATDPNKEMHALCWNGKKDIRYERKPKPIITDARDVIVRITSTTICGSDCHIYNGTITNMHTGDIIGHEGMGIVEDVGAEVQQIKPGMRVAIAFGLACGYCDYCKKEQFTGCDNTNPSKLQESMYGHQTTGILGYSHLTGGYPGAQAEWIRVPFADVNCLPIPDNLPDDKALFLTDIIPTAYFGTELGGVKKGSTVGIWGLGPVGLLIARWCQIKGASKIIGIDCVPERLLIAQTVLGIPTINFVEQDVKKTIEELVPGGIEVGIEAAGPDYPKTLRHKIETAVGLETDTGDILSEIIYCVKKYGTVTIIGAYVGTTNHFPIGALMEKALTLNGGQCPVQKYWGICLDKLRSGELDPSFLITTRGTLAEGPELYERFFNKENGILKVFMTPHTSDLCR